MTEGPRYWAVLVAAGAGTRMGTEIPKPWLPLAGRTVLEWSLTTLLRQGWIDGVVLVLAAGDSPWSASPMARHPRVLTVTGGAQRADSVRAGLTAVRRHAGWPDRTWVLVHDAARPCLREEALLQLRDAATTPAGGLLARPLTDTLKRHQDGRVVETVPRAHLAGAQTPQQFPLLTLVDALARAAAAGAEVTDEASAIEALGLRPTVVWGHASNLKITYPDDLALATFWLRHQAGESNHHESV